MFLICIYSVANLFWGLFTFSSICRYQCIHFKWDNSTKRLTSSMNMLGMLVKYLLFEKIMLMRKNFKLFGKLFIRCSFELEYSPFPRYFNCIFISHLSSLFIFHQSSSSRGLCQNWKLGSHWFSLVFYL